MMYFNSCSMMSHQASAQQAEASFSCANIALSLDAILLASIFVVLAALSLGSLLLALLALIILRHTTAGLKDVHRFV